MNQNAIIKCDKCEHEFFLNAVGINEATVELNGVNAILVYFACPKCNKIYRISIQDKRYYEMKEDVEKIRRKLYNNCNGGNENVKNLQSMIIKKQERLKAYVDKVNKTFSGTFVFVTSENNHKENIIKYLP